MESIWSLAESKVQQKNAVETDDRSMLLLGNKSSGKTSIILRFLEKADEKPKPSISLVYTFGRRQKSHSIDKDVVHIWELAGGTYQSNLMEVAIQPSTIPSFSLVVVVDLSRPDELWITLETLLKEASLRIDQLIRNNKSVKSVLEVSQNSRKLSQEHKDHRNVNVFPVPLLIVGSKFDLFQKFSTIEKRSIMQTLRFWAHKHCAHLVFHSEYIASTSKPLNIILNHFAFKTLIQRQFICDDSKPLFITAGQDSFEHIGSPITSDGSPAQLPSEATLEDFKKHFTQIFKQKNFEELQDKEDPSKDPYYADDVIDRIRKLKDRELEQYRLIAERKFKDKSSRN